MGLSNLTGGLISSATGFFFDLPGACDEEAYP